MTLPESETVDHPQKREEKTQNADSHNTIKLEQPNKLESTITTPKQFMSQRKTPHKSEENEAIDKEVWSELSPLYTVYGHLHLLKHLWRGYISAFALRATSYIMSR